MVFNIENFSPIGGQGSRGKAPQVFSYSSADTVADVNTEGYFNDVASLVEVGDFVLAFLDTGGAPQGYVLSVASNASGVVDVTDGLALGSTDTD